MHLRTLWFVLDAILWVGFLILEGFDFGVGMLHAWLAKDDTDRRVAINSIGPFWDGNEVWLIVAAAVIFAAFPAWYATMFSALYLAALLLLAALIIRGVSFEYQRKVDDERWRATFRWTLVVGSFLIPFLVGVALGDLLHGLPINQQGDYTGSFWGLLTPFGLWTGVTLVVLSLLLGSTYLTLKTTGDLHDRVARVSATIGWIAVPVVLGYVIWVHVGLGSGFVPNPIDAFALLAVIGAAWAASSRQEGWAFLAAALGMGGAVGTIFVQLYPNVLVSTTNAAYNLTIANTASPSYTLGVMTVVAAVALPVILLYQGWSYHVFRARLRAPRQGSPVRTPGAGTEAGAGAESGAGTSAEAGADGLAGRKGPL